jgi:antitoxin component HigA of HigAB toxin-antitoxin module
MKINKQTLPLLIIVTVIILFAGCRALDTKNTEIKRFEKDLFTLELNSPEKIRELKENYPDFFPVFCSEIISIGPANSPQIHEILAQFVKDPVITQIYEMTDSVYPDLNNYENEIHVGLNNFNKMLDISDTIQLISYISGFNQSFVSIPGILGISLDNFLGAETEYYKHLAIPQYLRQSMDPEHLSVNAVRAWILSEVREDPEMKTLLDHMIYEGKILYLLKESLPKEKEYNIFNYSQEQLEWCLQYEANMWEYIIEKELLYSPDRILISRITREAPFVREFGQESPGRAGSWLGFRIVSSYMKKTGQSASELINTIDSRKILSESRYRPA